MKRLSKDEAAWADGWSCDVCLNPIAMFEEATAGRDSDEEQKIGRHARCAYLVGNI